jgi:hypothetical protein
MVHKKKRYVVWGEILLDRETGTHFVRNIHAKKVMSEIKEIKYKHK